MKLDLVTPNIESSVDLEEKHFSIGNIGLIFDILRNKMYSNPILAICREYSCNALDSHREAGKPEVPIQIYLPNNLEHYYKIKDFGMGISPDRMENTFIKYGNSTKREDNVQIGSFGLGAKCAFSMVDSFSIITNYNGVKYNYACFIDETKTGKLSLLSECSTLEGNGTEIIIPVKPKNFTEFSTWTEQSCRHWKVKPIIKGGTIVWHEDKKILEGNGWAIISNRDYYRGAKVIIDGIEYPLELELLKKYADTKLIDSSSGQFLLYFNTGDLSLSASREQIYIDEKTQKALRNKLKIIIDEIKKTTQDKINTFDNYYDAKVFYHTGLKSVFHYTDFMGNLYWNNILLNDHSTYSTLKCPVLHFSKGTYSYRKGSDPNKITRSNSQHINYITNSVIYINDLPLKEPTAKHVKKAFDNDPTLKSLQLVCPTDQLTIDILNKTNHLDKMNAILLSTIATAVARKTNVSTNRSLVFKYDPVSEGFRQVSLSSIKEDTNTKILCSLNNVGGPNGRIPILQNGKRVFVSNIGAFHKIFAKHSFYGIDNKNSNKKIETYLNSLTQLDSFITNNIFNNKDFNFLKIKVALNDRYNYSDLNKICNDKICNLIKDPKSLYLKYKIFNQEMYDLANSSALEILTIYESINGSIDSKVFQEFIKNNPELDVRVMNEKFYKKYPLLKHISRYNYDDISEDIAKYINMIDAE